MATTQSGFSTRKENEWVFKYEQKLIKQSKKFHALFSDVEKKELRKLLREYDFLKMVQSLDHEMLNKLLNSAKKKNLKESLEREIKTHPYLEIFKFFLSKFEYQYQYSIIEIVKKTSTQGFLLDLDQEKIDTMRSWRKLKVV